MTSWDFVRSPAGVRMLVATGAQHGLPAAACLHGTGLRVGDLEREEHVEARQELGVARNLLRGLGDRPGLGVQVGARAPSSTLTDEQAAGRCRTWGEALALVLRVVQRTSSFLRAETVTGPQTFSVLLYDDEIPLDVRDFLAERDLAAFGASLRAVVGDMSAARVQTRLHGERADALAGVLGPRTALVTDREIHGLRMPAAVLDTPLPGRGTAPPGA